MKAIRLFLILIFLLLIIQACKRDDENKNMAKITIGTTNIRYFNPTTVSAYAPLEGFIIKLSDDSMIFTIALLNKTIGEYNVTNQNLAPGEALFYLYIHSTYFIATEGNVSVTDTTGNKVSGTFSIKGTEYNTNSVAFSVQNGRFTGVPVETFVYGSVMDYENNQYKTIEIGTQLWMAQNFRAKKYADGDSIIGVYTYNHNDSLADIYGRLYTWNAATRNSKLEMVQGACPEGWHLPSSAEWQQLVDYLGGEEVAAIKLKSLTTWNFPNISDNSSGFNAVAAGLHQPVKYYPDLSERMGIENLFWTSTFDTTYTIQGISTAWYRYIWFGEGGIYNYPYDVDLGFSIRCVQNANK